MKKFKFRLQTVLDMREKTLEAKQLEMASIVKLLNDQISKFDTLSLQKDNIRKSLETIYDSGEELDILCISNYKNYLGKVINDIIIQQGIINNTRSILQGKQIEVNEAFKAVKVLEKLKEKQQEKFYFDFNKKDAKEIDDMTNSRYHAFA